MADKKLFRKKPVVIEAIQWDGTLAGIDDIISVFPDIRTVAKTAHPPTNKCSFWKIGTLEGSHEVSAGDFIIRGVKGEYYPCKPDIFFMTYEPAEATPLADALEHAGTRAEFHPDSEIAVLCRKAAAALRARAVPDEAAKDAERYRACRRAALAADNDPLIEQMLDWPNVSTADEFDIQADQIAAILAAKENKP